jgi:hypothetical protein
MKECRYLYGDDADGNRGVYVTDYEFEDDDYEDLLSQIAADNAGRYYYTFIDSNDEQQEIEVDLDEVFDKLLKTYRKKS